MRLSLLIILSILAFTGNVIAQSVVDTVKLATINVSATRIYASSEYQPVSVSQVDSVHIQSLAGKNLGDILDMFAPVFVKSNGPGGLSTLSLRGNSASQTQVLWNGFLLNHAMLGQTDLSLIPSFAINSITVSSGNGSTSFGDKGGGTVALSTETADHEVAFSQAAGSFGKTVTEIKIGTGIKTWKFGFVGGYDEADNNFTYKTKVFSNAAGGFIDIEKKRNNNEQKAATGIFSANWKKDEKELESVLWLHDSDNNIPGGISSLSDSASQQDKFVRWMSRYVTSLHGEKLTLKSYINRQELNYFDAQTDVSSLSTSTSVIADIELNSSLSRDFQLNTAAQIAHHWVDANEYSGKADRTNLSVQLNPVWHLVNHWYLFGGVRFDYYNDFKDVLTYSLGQNFELINHKLFLKAQGSHNFVAPTFNDLYWPELGDPDLGPETNDKFETGLFWVSSSRYLSSRLELTGYYAHVHDGIRWIPGSDGKSRPQNLESVIQKGIEFSSDLTFTFRQLTINLTSHILKNRSYFNKARYENDTAVGYQLRYTPEWQVKESILLGWNGLTSTFGYTWTDDRYTTADHSSRFDPLPDYRHASWSASYHFQKGKFHLIPLFSVYNLFDEEYEIVQDYPLPGRNYFFKITTKLSL